MSRNGSGTYSLPAGNPVVTNEVISSNWANTTLSDIASALTDSLSRSGLGAMTAPLNLASGAIGAPGLNWSAETTSGLYRAGAGDFRYAIGGVDIFTITSAGFNAATLNVSGAATFTRTWTSGNSGAVTLSAAQPLLEVDQSGAAANQRRWWMTATGEELLFQAANDARTSATTFMQITRTNNTADAIALTSTALTWNGNALPTLGTAQSWSEQQTFTKNRSAVNEYAVLLSAATPSIGWTQTGAASDNKKWQMTASSEQFGLYATNDAENTQNTVMLVDRTGATVDRMTFPTETADSFVVGPINGLTVSSNRFRMRTSGNACALLLQNSGTATTLAVENSAAGDKSYVTFLEGINLRGSISYNSGGGVIAYNTTCREALKTNIRPSASALNFVKSLPIVSFDWKNSSAKLPYFVTYERTEKLAPWACQSDGVDVSKLLPALYKAVQEIISHLGL